MHVCDALIRLLSWFLNLSTYYQIFHKMTLSLESNNLWATTLRYWNFLSFFDMTDLSKVHSKIWLKMSKLKVKSNVIIERMKEIMSHERRFISTSTRARRHACMHAHTHAPTHPPTHKHTHTHTHTQTQY